MAIDLTGISNENEFYTHHYLSAILEGDLKELFGRWSEAEKTDGEQTPHQRLGALVRPYFTMRNEMARALDDRSRRERQFGWLVPFFESLGYEPRAPYAVLKELEDGGTIPLLGEVVRENGAPDVWIVEALSPGNESVDPLLLELSPAQLNGGSPVELPPGPLEEVVTRSIFALSEPPRWVLVASADQIVLLDRTKWSQKRLLRFDLSEILGRRNTATLKAMAALLHRESLAPESRICLLDTLDESSHKHAFAVSEDLKYSVREAVELLGNEAVHYLREALHEKLYERGIAEELTRECLRYLYRLLFVFYVEARPELGYAPMQSEEYRTGYSLESLRDLELVPLESPDSREGYFIHHSLDILFRLIHDGFHHEAKQTVLKESRADDETSDVHTFRIDPLRSHLFDPDRTPLLNRVKFRNAVLQKVLELLSLSRPRSGKKNRRGRISYAQLGINQLGAVYEGLLSYSGFFAEEDLYEVKKAGEKHNELENAYFVLADKLADYEDDEKVYDEKGHLRKYPKGSFIYRLAGRNREKSASYYTPEVLTQCVVTYALKELLKDKKADDILELTLCEPALGSGAFANEAVNQLAEAYLEQKQAELGRTIRHERYTYEKQQVKAYIADNNVYGVDLNPTAVELAEVSIWLNTIYAGHSIPWFGNQLAVGNSLIGARRQVFSSDLVTGKDRAWLSSIPERVEPNDERPAGSIYHFLLPDEGMADYRDKVVKKLVPKEMSAMKSWRKEFTEQYSSADMKALEKLSSAADKLWERHIDDRRQIRSQTWNSIPVFGHEDDPGFSKGDGAALSTREKEKLYRQRIQSEGIKSSSPYRRLKLAMDYWCAFWFWPIEKAHLLPTRDEYLLELAMVLEGTSHGVALLTEDEQGSLFPESTDRQERLKLLNEYGFVDVDELAEKVERLGLIKEIAKRHRFLHWELEFADLFQDRGGFDLILGNPPWIKIEWNEGGVMGDFEPLFVLRKFSASKLNQLREETLKRYPQLRAAYLGEYVELDGSQNFLNALQNYPLLKGTQSNSYKCFLPTAWYVGSAAAADGFLHPEGVYDDPKGGGVRQVLYPRLKYHFQFQNGLQLFPEVAHRARFSINIYSNRVDEKFFSMSNLFHPSTVNASFDQHGSGPVLGIKNDEGKWNLEGHHSRIIEVDGAILAMFARLYDPPGTPPLQARLPSLHTTELVAVLEKFARYPKRLGDLEGEYLPLEMWHETNAQKDGTIRRETRFPKDLSEWILSGPHFNVANPYYKTPRRVCTEKGHYDPLDLTTLPADYLPRTNYVPACDEVTYRLRTLKVPWDEAQSVTDSYRVAFRRMMGPSAERTLISAMAPKSIGHINTVLSVVFASLKDLALFASLCVSTSVDFYVKTTGRSDVYGSLLKMLPLLEKHDSKLVLRALLLNCVTDAFGELWKHCWQSDFRSDQWTKQDARLVGKRFCMLDETWCSEFPCRSDYERHQALVEIDVLAAMALGFTQDELCAIYRIQFPVLQQNERDTWYDQNGRIVFTVSKGRPGVGFKRKEWNEIKDMKEGTVTRTITDDTVPDGPVERVIEYVAPFDRCDREEDYALAWKSFEERLK